MPITLNVASGTAPACLGTVMTVNVIINTNTTTGLIALRAISHYVPTKVLVNIIMLVFSLRRRLLPTCTLLVLVNIVKNFFIIPLGTLLRRQNGGDIKTKGTVTMRGLNRGDTVLLVLNVCSLTMVMNVPIIPVNVNFNTLFTLTVATL